MKNIFLILSLVISLSLTAQAKAQDAVVFTKTAYESMLGINQASPDFAQAALNNFKNYFSFNEFAHRTMQDFEGQLAAEQKMQLTNVFRDLFFDNFLNKTGAVAKRQIASPQYTLRTAAANESQVDISGQSTDGFLTVSFCLQLAPDHHWQIIDLEIDSILLSRNYRGAFNRVFRQKGFSGLMEKLLDQTKKL